MTNSKSEILSPEAKYYENDALWSQDFDQNPQERQRLDETIALIPDDIRSVLDVGCGNGAFVNRLVGKYDRICGVDRSEAALKFVQTENRCASADTLPFSDQEFDLVTSMEMLEHLPEGIFQSALKELYRTSKRWVMITVPYKEDRHLGLVRCPKCLCEFNRSYHLRDFDDRKIAGLFSDIGIGLTLRTKISVGTTPRFLGLRIAKYLTAPLRSSDLPRGVTCPQCAYHRPASKEDYDLGGARTSTGVLGRRKQLWPHVTIPRWYIALFEKD
jgi:SAM-dependent methyltransferase